MRHGAHGLLPHTLAGRQAVPLSPEGMAQAVRLARHFAGEPVAAVVSSPVHRALETAAPIAAALSRPVLPDDGLAEIDFGRWTGLPFDQLAADPSWGAWNALRSLSACPGGETMHQAQSRALSALSGWRQRHPDGTVVLVSHADIIKALLAPALGLPIDRLYRVSIDPASISTLIVFEGDLRVDRVNARP